VLPGRLRRLPVRPLAVPRLPAVPLPVLADGTEPGAPAGARSGASPQVSQYPPSMVPPQPGRAHLAGPTAAVGAAGAAGALGAAAAAGAPGSGARPQVSQYPPSMVPPQPGRAHLVIVASLAGASLASGGVSSPPGHRNGAGAPYAAFGPAAAA
jgi:hypothetical protein